MPSAALASQMLHIWMEAVRGNIFGCYKQQRDGEIVQGLHDMVKHRQRHWRVTVNSAAMVAHRVWYVELEEWLWVKNHLNSQVEWYVCILVALEVPASWTGRGEVHLLSQLLGIYCRLTLQGSLGNWLMATLHKASLLLGALRMFSDGLFGSQESSASWGLQ